MVYALKLKESKYNVEPKLELVVDNVVNTIPESFIEVFKDQNGSLINENQWFVNGEFDGSRDYTGLLQKFRYSIAKIKSLYQKEPDFTKQEMEWFKNGKDPNYIALLV